jgi:hypothetical protein
VIATGSRRAAAVVVLSLLLVVAVAAPAAPAARSGGDLEGVVVHGVEGSGVGDLEVILTEAVEDEVAEVAVTVTDVDGGFAFEDVPHGADYEVLVTFDEAVYRTGPVTVAPGQRNSIEIEVFASTEAIDDVVVASWVVWVDRLGGVSIQHDLQVDNRGERTYLGEAPDALGARSVIPVPLEPEAFGLRFLGRFTQCCATMRGTDYVHTSALPPGTTTGTLRYTVDVLETLTLPARLPVETFTIMVPAGVTVATSQLQLSGEIDSQGNSYDVYTAEGLDRGEVLELSFRGLTVADTPTWLLAAAAVVLSLVGLGIAWWWARRQRAPAPAAATPAAATPAAATPAARRSRPAPPVVADGPAGLSAQLLIEEIALLDLGLERGLLAPEAHEQLRAARKAELVAISSRTEG